MRYRPAGAHELKCRRANPETENARTDTRRRRISMEKYKTLRERFTELGVSSSNIDDTELIIKFYSMVQAYENDVSTYETDVYDLAALQAVVVMAEGHPGFQDLDNRQKNAIDRFLGFCKRVWTERGITQDEADRISELFREEDICEKKL